MRATTQGQKESWYFVLAAISFMIAAISIFGLVLRGDVVGRLMFGGVWTLVGIGWLVRAARTSGSLDPSAHKH